MDPSDSASEPSTTSQFEFDATMTEQYKDMLDVSKLSLDANKSENPLRKTFYFTWFIVYLKQLILRVSQIKMFHLANLPLLKFVSQIYNFALPFFFVISGWYYQLNFSKLFIIRHLNVAVAEIDYLGQNAEF